MIEIRITGCNAPFINVYKIDCAEILHDYFNYNIKKAKEIVNLMISGKEFSMKLPTDCDNQKILKRFSEIGVNYQIIHY